MNDNFDLTTVTSATEQTLAVDTTTVDTTEENTTAPATLPKNYLVNGYEGPDALDFYDRYAREIAAKLSPMDKEQFRAFYAKVDNACCDSFEVRQRTVAKLTAAARNMVLHNNAPQIFYDLFEANRSAIQTLRDFSYFRDHLECIYCYMK